jgi:hypothetical protein
MRACVSAAGLTEVGCEEKLVAPEGGVGRDRVRSSKSFEQVKQVWVNCRGGLRVAGDGVGGGRGEDGTNGGGGHLSCFCVLLGRRWLMMRW